LSHARFETGWLNTLLSRSPLIQAARGKMEKMSDSMEPYVMNV
jgi:hypothetical protein